jgi:hypothetical protein
MVPNNSSDADSSAAYNVVPVPVQDVAPKAVLNADTGTLLSAERLPVPHAAASSTKEVVAALPEDLSVNLAIPPATSSAQTIPSVNLNVFGITVDQVASSAQLSSRSLKGGQAGVLGVNPATATKPSDTSKFATNSKDENKDSSDNATGLNLHKSSAFFQPELQKDGQGTTQSSNHGQNSSASQGQDTVRPNMSVANHAVAASTASQPTVNTSPSQNSAIPAGANPHAAKTPDNTTPASTTAPQALPVINTAKLIQSMGQSEMRVGMRSTEFGNISISTSSTRDLISAQISLDHGELARTLATHLPEISAKLGNQQMDVRIDMNGASVRQSGTPNEMSNGSADPSRGGRQQTGNANLSSLGNHLTGQRISPIASGVATRDNGLNARLDIRV